jgi:hypothetical protein
MRVQFPAGILTSSEAYPALVWRCKALSCEAAKVKCVWSYTSVSTCMPCCVVCNLSQGLFFNLFLRCFYLLHCVQQNLRWILQICAYVYGSQHHEGWESYTICNHLYSDMKFEVVLTMNIEITVFVNVQLYNLLERLCSLGGTSNLHFQCRKMRWRTFISLKWQFLSTKVHGVTYQVTMT